jgi:hypothetical protein
VPQQNLLSRRGFVGVTASLVSAPAVLVTTVIPADAYDPGNDETRSKYRETDHVKAFYRTNRYETES